ncbi:chondroitin synthase [Geobacter sp. OR-1]|uniref:glycosyltransferase family 2 protein n=1 Tax=Geobacter sp. OR-1 TaxID=1266765 RepID=UPI0005423BAA|nr:glycosyltransferase family 2 protein [Geobacter sp. OR-1]GAM08024.1 chondroitin synthase [Geobacter sp. OR-1]
MKNDTIISIVTPSFNQGEFLAETIESVLSQEGEFAIDYLIVDGGSTDDSVAIIKRYDDRLKQGKWPVRCSGISLRWLSEQDQGQTDALIKGFRMASGEIFAWLNSDDTYLPGALQTVTDFFRTTPDLGLLYGDARYIDPSGDIIGAYHTEEFSLERLAVANIICQPTAFFRRDDFEAVGGLDMSLRFVMDYDLWIRLARRVPCCYLPQLLATYRLHGSSKTMNRAALIDNSEEALAVTRRHFSWAPITRVYTACSIRCRESLPGLLGASRMITATAAIICTVVRSLVLNRGINRSDLRLLNRENFCKLFKDRLELMTGRTP